MNLPHGSHNKDSDSNNRATPQYILQALKLEPLEFDIDACAPRKDIWEQLPISRYCKSYISLDEGFDARTTPFYGRVWMNPPFGRNSGKLELLSKMAQHRQGIALVPGAFNTLWFQASQPDIMFMPQSRVRFIKFDGQELKSQANGSASFPTLLLGWGDWAVDKLMNVDERYLPGFYTFGSSYKAISQPQLFLPPPIKEARA